MRPKTVLALLPTLVDAPPGFKPVAEADALRRGRSGERYVVAAPEGRLRIETWLRWRERGAEIYERTASGSRGVPIAPRQELSRIKLGDMKMALGLGWGLEVTGGWLSAWTFGEFGGGLLFVADATGAITLVDQGNTILLARTSRGIFAVQGLAHGGDFGRLVQVHEPEPDVGWQVEAITDLHGEPSAVAQDGDRLLFASGRFVSTLETDGRQREIYRVSDRTGIGSLVSLPNGDLWAGAPGAVLRLRRKASATYTAQWFAPLSGTGKPTRVRPLASRGSGRRSPRRGAAPAPRGGS